MLILGIRSEMTSAQESEIKLLVRVDDMGFSHAANVACIYTFQQGIARSVEVMVPGPWFEEAVRMLQDNPGLDVGIHLTLTSEWSNLKWRPLTYCPSLTDEDGYFFPMVFKNDRFPPNRFLGEAPWQLTEIERELRAQIELAIKKIPQVSHLTAHMGVTSMHDETKSLLVKLAREYDLHLVPENLAVARVPRWSGKEFNAKQKERRFLDMLDQLTPGTWLLVEHPGYDTEELETVGHPGYENVAADRDGVTRVLTSKKVQRAIAKKNISLINYTDLVGHFQGM